MTDLPTTDFSTLPPIMAVDFDGTLVGDAFPEIGRERESLCNIVREFQSKGVKSILWTSRTGEHLEAAVKWCEEHDLHFDAVNENVAEVLELTGQDTRKVYADVYIDDKNCGVHALDVREYINRRTNWLERLA